MVSLSKMRGRKDMAEYPGRAELLPAEPPAPLPTALGTALIPNFCVPWELQACPFPTSQGQGQRFARVCGGSYEETVATSIYCAFCIMKAPGLASHRVEYNLHLLREGS